MFPPNLFLLKFGLVVRSGYGNLWTEKMGSGGQVMAIDFVLEQEVELAEAIRRLVWVQGSLVWNHDEYLDGKMFSVESKRSECVWN